MICHRISLPMGGAAALLMVLLAAGCRPTEEGVGSAADEEPAKLATSPMARPDLDLGSTEQVRVTATGSGATRMAAIDDALLLAIRQVNGQSINVASLSLEESTLFAMDDEQVNLSSSSLARAVATRYGGVVSSFRLLDTRKLRGGGYEVQIEAGIARYEAPESARMPRLVVAPVRVAATDLVIDRQRLAPTEVADDLRRAMTDSMGRTGRFSILDREMVGEVEAELALIASGEVTRSDMARLGQALGADLVWVGVLGRFEYPRQSRKLRTSDRSVVSHSGGARLSHRLINLTTRQLLLSATEDVELPPTEPTTLGTSVDEGAIRARLVDGLIEQASNAVIDKLFPITAVAVEGDDVVLSQGGTSLQAGERYRTYLLGRELHDPQTGRSLGRTEREAGVIEVLRVSNELSYAAFVDRRIDIPSPYVPGSLEVRERVEGSAPLAAAASRQPSAAPPPAKRTAPPPAPPPKASRPEARVPASTSDDDW